MKVLQLRRAVAYLHGRTFLVACGCGRDSTAMLAGLRMAGLRPARVLFANVGAEKQATYDFIPHLQSWLASVDFPELTIVRYVPKRASYRDLEGNMSANCTLPGAVFGRASCTLKWKIEPQNKYCRQDAACLAAWSRGEKVIKLIGFEACEDYRRNRAADKAHMGKGSPDAERYEWQYPLMDWGWGLDRCIEEIDAAGMPVPPKSSCTFCPNMRPEELHDLTPLERAKSVRMELRAEPFNRKAHGLWRRPRKTMGLPGSHTEYFLQHGLDFAPLEELEPIPLNPACGHAQRGYTFRPPHLATTLREQLETAGHDLACEDEIHRQLVAQLP